MKPLSALIMVIVVGFTACSLQTNELSSDKNAEAEQGKQVEILNRNANDRILNPRRQVQPNRAPYKFYLREELNTEIYKGELELYVEDRGPEGKLIVYAKPRLFGNDSDDNPIEADIILCLSHAVISFTKRSDQNQANFIDMMSDSEEILVDNPDDPEGILALWLPYSPNDRHRLSLKGLFIDPTPDTDWTGDWGYCDPNDEDAERCKEAHQRTPLINPDFTGRIEGWIKALTAGFSIKVQKSELRNTANPCLEAGEAPEAPDTRARSPIASPPVAKPY